jgi:hypothetical protein
VNDVLTAKNDAGGSAHIDGKACKACGWMARWSTSRCASAQTRLACAAGKIHSFLRGTLDEFYGWDELIPIRQIHTITALIRKSWSLRRTANHIKQAALIAQMW